MNKNHWYKLEIIIQTKALLGEFNNAVDRIDLQGIIQAALANQLNPKTFNFKRSSILEPKEKIGVKHE